MKIAVSRTSEYSDEVQPHEKSKREIVKNQHGREMTVWTMEIETLEDLLAIDDYLVIEKYSSNFSEPTGISFEVEIYDDYRE